MGELTNKVGRDDNARLAYLKQAGWGKPINMFCKDQVSLSETGKENWLWTFRHTCKCPQENTGDRIACGQGLDWIKGYCKCGHLTECCAVWGRVKARSL